MKKITKYKEEDVPYQTFAASLLHEFVSGYGVGGAIGQLF